MAQSVKRPPAIQESQVQSLSWEDHLEKEMATHSNILAREFPWTGEPGGLYIVHEVASVRHGLAHNNQMKMNLTFL